MKQKLVIVGLPEKFAAYHNRVFCFLKKGKKLHVKGLCKNTSDLFLYSYYILPTTVTRKLNALNANNPVTFAI